VGKAAGTGAVKSGQMWRAEFLSKVKEASAFGALSTVTGQALNNQSTLAEFEAYFQPLLTATTKWEIEYNIASLVEKEDYIP
jgi:hypothetical protein